MMLEIIAAGFPAEYQILCFNCNIGRSRNGGRCPHAMPRPNGAPSTAG